MKPLRLLPAVEILEARIAPATLDVVAGALTYTAELGVANVVTLSINASNYTISDTEETITLGAGAITAGFTGGGTNAVSGPTAMVSSLSFVLRNLDDSFTVASASDPLTVDGGAGEDTIVVAGPLAITGDVSLTSEMLEIDGTVACTTATFIADEMEISEAVTATDRLTLHPFTVARPIDLGTETAGQLSLSKAESDLLTSAVLQVGRSTAASIVVSDAFGPAGVPTVTLETAGTVTQTAPLTVANLRVGSGLSVTLTHADNDVNVLVGKVATDGADFSFRDVDALSIGLVDGGMGLSVPAAAGSVITLEAGGDLTQTQAISGAQFAAISGEDVLLTNGTNDVAIFAAQAVRSVSYTNGGALTVDTAGTLSGITAGSSVGLTTGNGNLIVADARAGADILASNPGSTFTAISTGGQDNRFELQANAEVNAVGLTITADQIDIAGTISTVMGGSGGSLTLRPSESSTAIDLGGADAAGTLGLSDAELDRITTLGLTVGGSSVGSLTVSAPVSIGAQVSSSIMLQADTMAIDQTLAAESRFSLRPASSTRPVNLGAEVAGSLSFDTAELDRITTPDALDIRTSGALTVSAGISPESVGTFSLSGSSVSGAGAIITPRLILDSGSSIALTGVNDVDFFSARNFNSNAMTFVDSDGFTIGDSTGGFANIRGITGTGTSLTTLAAGTGTVTFASSLGVSVDIAGTAPGTGYDQFIITGGVDLGGRVLGGTVSVAPAPGTELTIIANDGVDPVVGTFLGLPEGAFTNIGGVSFRVSYVGGDGNDVVLTTAPALAVTLSADGRTATFTDVDRDLVTVKTNKGAFDGSEFLGVQVGPNGESQLQELVLDADFAGANISIAAKRSADGGNGFVNVGFINAAGVDLGMVSVSGDLARILAGTVGGDTKVPALKSLTVQSFGVLDTGTQGLMPSVVSVLEGGLPKLTVTNNFAGELRLNGATDGMLGSAKIGGSMDRVSTSPRLVAAAGIGSVNVAGEIDSATITTDGQLGTLIVKGRAFGLGVIAFGQLTAPTKGQDTAIKSINIRGSLDSSIIEAGTAGLGNADASIGSITVGGDWIRSSVMAGTESGPDSDTGTDDDTKVTIAGARDNPALFSTLGSLTIKGQALGSISTFDTFGVVAERIGKVKIGAATLPFTSTKNDTPECFFAAPTGPGENGEQFDFTVRELGLSTPVLALAIGLDVTKGNVATWTDEDGDLVTLRTNVGTFDAGDFTFTTAPSGGGHLDKLTLDAAFAGANLTFTAKRGAAGGNGFVNVTAIDATGVNLGNVSVAGDLVKITAESADPANPAVKSLKAQSIGATGVGLSTSTFAGGLGKLTVATEVRGVTLDITGATTGRLGSAKITGTVLGATISAEAGTGALSIGGSLRDGRILSAGALGAISIGGDLIGNGLDTTISAFGQLTAPAKGPDLAIKSLTVKGGIERARIEAGTDETNANADASIGAISVGRAWLSSSVLAGAAAGADGFLGTADDAKAAGTATTRDQALIFAQIAGITIKGQALGTTPAGDHLGIVAEQIVKAKLGAVTFKLDAGERDAADAFALAPTAPGVTAVPSDFFLREIV